MNYIYKVSLVCLMLIVSTFNVFSQKTVSFFQKMYTSDSNDVAKSIVQVNDGGYVMAGHTDGFGLGNKSEIFVLKTDDDGNALWMKTFGGTENEYVECMSATEGGGVIIGGYTASFGNIMGFLCKLDRDGGEEWTKTYARTGFSGFSVKSILQRSNGRYIVAGDNNKNMVLMEVSSTGDTLWTKQHHASYNFPTFPDKSVDLIQLSDGYVLMGTMLGISNQNAFYILRTDLQGNTTWEKSYATTNDDNPFTLTSTYDNGLLLGGSIGDGTFWSNVLFVRTDGNGDTLWTKSFDYATLDNDRVIDLFALEDSTYLFLARSEIDGPSTYNILLGNMDDNGNLLWVKEFGDSLDDYAFACTIGMDNEIVIVSRTKNFNADDFGIHLIKTFSWDSLCNIKNISDSIQTVNYVFTIENMDTTENLLSIDFASATFQENDVLASLISNTICTDTFIDSSDIVIGTFINVISNSKVTAYPNPTSNQFYIDLSNQVISEKINIEVLDLMGRLIFKEQVLPIQNKLELDLSSYSDGTYLLRIYSDEIFTQIKVIKQ